MDWLWERDETDTAANGFEVCCHYRRSSVPKPYHKTIHATRRMIGVDDETIHASLKNLDPNDAIARALQEVLCLRSTIDGMIEKEFEQKKAGILPSR